MQFLYSEVLSDQSEVWDTVEVLATPGLEKCWKFSLLWLQWVTALSMLLDQKIKSAFIDFLVKLEVCGIFSPSKQNASMPRNDNGIGTAVMGNGEIWVENAVESLITQVNILQLSFVTTSSFRCVQHYILKRRIRFLNTIQYRMERNLSSLQSICNDRDRKLDGITSIIQGWIPVTYLPLVALSGEEVRTVIEVGEGVQADRSGPSQPISKEVRDVCRLISRVLSLILKSSGRSNAYLDLNMMSSNDIVPYIVITSMEARSEVTNPEIIEFMLSTITECEYSLLGLEKRTTSVPSVSPYLRRNELFSPSNLIGTCLHLSIFARSWCSPTSDGMANQSFAKVSDFLRSVTASVDQSMCEKSLSKWWTAVIDAAISSGAVTCLRLILSHIKRIGCIFRLSSYSTSKLAALGDLIVWKELKPHYDITLTLKDLNSWSCLHAALTGCKSIEDFEIKTQTRGDIWRVGGIRNDAANSDKFAFNRRELAWDIASSMTVPKSDDWWGGMRSDSVELSLLELSSCQGFWKITKEILRRGLVMIRKEDGFSRCLTLHAAVLENRFDVFGTWSS